MKILSIGNSFSTDAQRYLHELAKHEGVEIRAVNLYIGGCSLRSHYLNMLDDNAAYDYEFNGEKTGIKVSIRQALASADWDYITLQQASHHSDRYETYEPYLVPLADYVRKYCPTAKLLVHQTWAYEKDSERLLEKMGYQAPEEMFSHVRENYEKMAKAIDAYATIPCGEAMLKASADGTVRVHRDTYHASKALGRYLLALCWYRVLTGKSVAENTFDAFDEPLTEEERRIALNAVQEVLG